jgi:hypothetical protein
MARAAATNIRDSLSLNSTHSGMQFLRDWVSPWIGMEQTGLHELFVIPNPWLDGFCRRSKTLQYQAEYSFPPCKKSRENRSGHIPLAQALLHRAMAWSRGAPLWPKQEKLRDCYTKVFSAGRDVESSPGSAIRRWVCLRLCGLLGLWGCERCWTRAKTPQWGP